MEGRPAAPAALPPRPDLSQAFDTIIDRSCLRGIETAATKITYKRPSDQSGSTLVHSLNRFLAHGLRLKGGKELAGGIDRELELRGEVEYGGYRIRLTRVRRVEFRR